VLRDSGYIKNINAIREIREAKNIVARLNFNASQCFVAGILDVF